MAETSQERLFVFLLYPGASLFSLAGLMEVYEQALLEQERSDMDFRYKFMPVSALGGRTPSYFQVGLETQPLSAVEGKPIHTLFVCGGLNFRDVLDDDQAIQWLKQNCARATRVCATGTGTFILARAGLLDGRRAVTHWLMNDMFAEMFPQVELVRDMIYLRNRSVWTSAGMGSAIDFALALLEEDEGREFAFKIAKRVLIMLRRSGDQPQISSVLSAQALEGSRFDRLHEWIYSNLRADLSNEALAAHVGMSPRNFSRVYLSKMGVTPANAVAKIRLEVALDALMRTDERLSTIAYECGFGDEQRMRRAFLRSIGRTPTDLRADRTAAEGEPR